MPQPAPAPAPTSTTARGRLRRAALVGVAALLAALAWRATQRSGSDFAVFHAAGARYVAGAPLYVSAGDAPYRYAPGIAALFAPLSQLPLPVARTLWVILSAALALAAAWILDRRVGHRAPLAVPLAWVCLSQPLAQELAHGQVDLVVLALVLAAFASADDGRPLGEGALVAVAAALKVAPAVIALDWIVRRRWRPLAGLAVGGVALAAPVVARYGLAGAWREHLAWIRSQSADAPEMIATVANQSFWAWARTVGAGAWGGAALVVALLALALADRVAARRREVLLASVPLVSAYGWPQLFVTAFPLLTATLATRGAAAWVAGCAAAGFSLLSYDVAGPAVEGWAQAHRLLGASLLVVVLAGRAAHRPATEGA